jgi:SAM-dependent methyltransferase
MIQTLTSFIKSLSNPNRYWFNTLIILAIFLVLCIFYKRQNLSDFYEGFSQDSKFVLKQDSNIYDDFYVKIYDILMVPGKKSEFEIEKIIEGTQPTKKSVFLDIGSGTGDIVNELNNLGYLAYGIDKSKSMIEEAEKKFPENKTKVGDATESMLYEKNSFTHITCLGFTIYQIKEKEILFRNCYNWLMPGGYLILHLADRNKFDPIIPGGKPPLLDSPQLYAKNRITDTEINFVDFLYKASYQFNDIKKTAILKETFTDELTKNVRQNEMTLYMEDIDDILRIVSKCGFLAQARFDMVNDKFQYIYILERPQ